MIMSANAAAQAAGLVTASWRKNVRSGCRMKTFQRRMVVKAAAAKENAQVTDFLAKTAAGAMAAAFATGLLMASPEDAWAARSGGRVGGKSFKSARPPETGRSSPSTGYAAPSPGITIAPVVPVPIAPIVPVSPYVAAPSYGFMPTFGFGMPLFFGGAFFRFMATFLLLGLIVSLVSNLFRKDDYDK